MIKKVLAANLLALWLAGTGWSAETPQKIRIGFPSLAFSYLPFYVAQEKGLLKKIGLESEYIQMRTPIQPQAVINGNINFFTSVSTGISAAVAGLPLVVVLNLYNGSPWILVTHKEINKPHDLVGKNLAISAIRTSPYYFLVAALKKWEIPEKEVGLISTGGTASSFAALTTNQVAGAVLTPPFDDKAVSLGFKKFQFLGDLADVPYVGLITSAAEMKNNRALVQKTIAAVLEATAWLRANRSETVKMIADKFKVTPSEAERTYETMISMLTKDGRLNPKVARGYL
ncbi:MAG TPA: ABC transporter substrate-binding protein, partial [Candidatus Binatia bacterium]